MCDDTQTLHMHFDGSLSDRAKFLKNIRKAVVVLTGETMTLDAIIHEIAKNIFDHAHGKGGLHIVRNGASLQFRIWDDGGDAYDFENCATHSRLAGNGVNFGIGLNMIKDFSQSLGINLEISTQKGFSYSGIYHLRS